MGAETPPATAAQPPAADTGGEQGRGDVDHLAGLYDLSTAPEHLRPHMQEELRKINAGLSRRFNEHAEYRQRWEPLEQIDGLPDVPPEDLNDLLAVREMIVQAAAEQDPDDEALYDWWNKLGEHFGFLDDQPDNGDPAAGSGEDPADGMPAWAQQLQQQVQTLNERLDGREQTEMVSTAQAQLDRELGQLGEQHNLDDDAQNTVLQLSLAYGGAPDALQRALADYFRIAGKAENGLLEAGDPNSQPGPSTPAGGQPAGEERPMRFGDPRVKQAAVERMRKVNAGAAA
jgi:hypothetical protein